jgi:endonuclease/exonuclease/phosphatase family metal-dependent hydrolase
VSQKTLSLLNREETGTLEDQENNVLIKGDFNDATTHGIF